MIDLTPFMWRVKAANRGRLRVEVSPHPQSLPPLCQFLTDYRIPYTKKTGNQLRIQDPRGILDWVSLVYCPPPLRDLIFAYVEACERVPLFKNRGPEVINDVLLEATRVLSWVDQNLPSFSKQETT